MALTIQDGILLSSILLLIPAVLVFYRLYLHPLAKFPGTKLAAATGWYETYIDLLRRPSGNFIEEIAAMHEKYGMDYGLHS